MSKLDELDLEISEYARSFSAPYAIEVDANALENEIKELARKYYNLGKLEEREVMRKFVDGINGKMIMCKNGCMGGLSCSDCGIKEEWIKKSDLLNELNK